MEEEKLVDSICPIQGFPPGFVKMKIL